MAKTWKPIVAGIWDIVCGILPPIYMAYGIITSLLDENRQIYLFDWWGDIVLPTILLTLAILALVGGLYSLKRKRWGWALAGSIAALLFYGIGIPALILVAISKKEFE